MEALTLNQIVTAVHGRLLGETEADVIVQDVCTDSRKIKKGALFIPLVGEKYIKIDIKQTDKSKFETALSDHCGCAVPIPFAGGRCRGDHHCP